MGLGDFSDKEKQILDNKFDTVAKQINAVQDSITSILRDLKATGGTILDEPALQGMFDTVRTQFSDLQKKLNTSIENFKAAARDYEQKRQALYDKEEEIYRRESEADASFASKREIQLAPVKKLMQELKEKEEYLISLQRAYAEEYHDTDRKLHQDYENLQKSLKEKFDAQLSVIAQERQALAKREDDLNEREIAVSKKESEVQAGLTQERQRMLEEIEVIKHEIGERQKDIDKKEVELERRTTELERKAGEISEREQAVQKREIEADAGFAQKKSEMLAEVDTMRQKCLEEIKQIQQDASTQCNQLLKETNEMLENARQTARKSQQVDLANRLADFESDLSNARRKLQEDRESLDRQLEELKKRTEDINAREQALEVKEAEYKKNQELLAESERIFTDKCREISEKEIKAAKDIAEKSNGIIDRLQTDLTSVQMKYQQQITINRRFASHNETADEIYSRICALEAENNRLQAKIKNLEAEKH